MFQCYLHNWFSHSESCPLCSTTVTATDIPIAPQNFDHVERYVSNLPVERVKWLREEALGALVADDDSEVQKLAGYILELTEMKN